MSFFFRNIEYARNYFFNTLDNLQKNVDKNVIKINKNHKIDADDNVSIELNEKNVEQKSLNLNSSDEEAEVEVVDKDLLDKGLLDKGLVDKDTTLDITTNKLTESYHDKETNEISSDTKQYIYDSDEESDKDLNEIFDENPYVFKNLYSNTKTTYHYINDRLNKEFGGCMDYDSTKYNVHFCIFAMNGSCSFRGDILPFLQFVFENNNGVYSFPTIEFNCAANIEPDVYFKNECIRKLLELFPIKQIDENILGKIYKGFLEFDESNIFVVFDFSNFFKSLSLASSQDSVLSTFFSSMKSNTSKSVWGIVNDIVEKNINDIPIQKIVIDFFQKYKYMKEIMLEYGYIVKSPIISYLCKIENNNFVNVISNENNNEFTYEKRSEHPLLGPFYIFTREKMEPNAKRFAVFIENDIVLDDSIEIIIKDHPELFSQILLEKSVIEYKENNKSFLCVKPETFFYGL